MIYKAEELIEKLYQHSNDYAEGRTQNFAEVCMDCKRAAEMIGVLKTSKHTQKRRRQRTSKKNREMHKKIENLTTELNQLRQS
jgi:hypothetical protein